MWGILQTVWEFGPKGDHDEEPKADFFYNDDIQKHGHSNDIDSGSILLGNASYILWLAVPDVVGHFAASQDESNNSVQASEGLDLGSDFIEDSADPDSQAGLQDPQA